MTITTVHKYKKLTVDSQNDFVWLLVLVISLQKFSNKSYFQGEIDSKNCLKNEQKVIIRFKKGLFWSKILDVKFSRVFIRYKDTLNIIITFFCFFVFELLMSFGLYSQIAIPPPSIVFILCVLL